jgi:hypothetical protein
MEKWSTQLQLKRNKGLMQSEPIKKKTGMFQGLSFSPFLFSITLVPLAHCLNRSICGYQV